MTSGPSDTVCSTARASTLALHPYLTIVQEIRD